MPCPLPLGSLPADASDFQYNAGRHDSAASTPYLLDMSDSLPPFSKRIPGVLPLPPGSAPDEFPPEAPSSEVTARVAAAKKVHEGKDMPKRFSAAAPEAMDLLLDVIRGEGAGAAAKISERIDVSRWLLEKATGKPKQEVEVGGDLGIRQLFAALDALKEAAQAGKDGPVETHRIIDVTASAPRDDIDDWVEQNVPTLTVEKK